MLTIRLALSSSVAAAAQSIVQGREFHFFLNFMHLVKSPTFYTLVQFLRLQLHLCSHAAQAPAGSSHN